MIELLVLAALMVTVTNYGGDSFKYDEVITMLAYVASLCIVRYIVIIEIMGDFGSDYSYGLAAFMTSYSLPLCVVLGMALGMRKWAVVISSLTGTCYLIGSILIELYLY